MLWSCPRVTIRMLLGAVATAAFGLGLVSEWSVARERDFYAGQERVLLGVAEDFEGTAADCRAKAAAGSLVPTDPTWVGLDRKFKLKKEGVADWGAASDWFARQATGHRASAGNLAALKRQLQGRLLLLP